MDGAVSKLDIFFKNDVLIEFACETINTCGPGQKPLKSILARALADAIQFAPYTKQTIDPKIQSSAAAAAKACTGDASSTICGFQWTKPFDNDTGLAQEINALQIILANLDRPALATVQTSTSSSSANSSSSGTSTGSATSGSATSSAQSGPSASPSTGTGVHLATPIFSVAMLLSTITAALAL